MAVMQCDNQTGGIVVREWLQEDAIDGAEYCGVIPIPAASTTTVAIVTPGMRRRTRMARRKSRKTSSMRDLDA
jgi:hypothetical protein